MEGFVGTHLFARVLEIWVMHRDALPVNIFLALQHRLRAVQQALLTVVVVLPFFGKKTQLKSRYIHPLQLAEVVELHLEFLLAISLQQCLLDVIVSQFDILTSDDLRVRNAGVYARLFDFGIFAVQAYLHVLVRLG